MKVWLTFIMVGVLLILSGIATAQEQDQTTDAYAELKARGEIYFSFQCVDKTSVDEVSRIVSIDNIDHTKGFKVYAYANLREFTEFLKLNISYRLEKHPGLMTDNPTMLDDLQNRDITSWDYYPTYSAYIAMMYQFETDYPGLCEIVSIGQSTNGRELLYAKISDNVDSLEAEPRINYTSTMHGDETVGFVLMLRLIDYLLSNYNTDPQVANLVNNIEIWINPNANPDGTYFGGNNTVAGAIRYNINNVDLNRNFPDFDDGPHPDGNPWQVETMAFMDFADSIEFVLGTNIHGGAEVVNYPWDTQSILHPDDAWWQFVAREYADTAQAFSPSGYLTQLNNGITNGYAWYTTSGNRQDYMNYYYHCREFTLEISNTKNPAASTLPSFWNYNYRSLLHYMEQALYGVKGIVTDSITGNPLEAQVTISGHDMDNSHVETKMPYGDYYRPIKAGTYAFTYSAQGYQSKTITLTVTDYDQITQDVQLGPAPPVAGFYAETTSSCTGDIQFIDQTNTSPGSTYLWNFGDGTTSIEINPLHIYSQDGIFDVSLTVTNGIGSNTITEIAYIEIDMPDAPVVVGDYVCGPQTAQLSATGNGVLQWFADSVGGSVLSIGTTFTTPVLSTTTNYYVSDSVEAVPQSAAKTDNSGGGGYYTSFTPHYLVFDCYAPVTLQSVKVYANSAGDRTILLQNSVGDVLETITVNIPAGEQVVDLNFEVPIANDLRLSGPPAPDLYRNNAGLSYPYELPGVLSVKHSSASSNPTGYYYYFYDWQVKAADCVSPRTKVTAVVNNSVPVPDFSYSQNGNTVEFTNLTIDALSYLWDFGDGTTSTNEHPVHQYQTSGTFTITLIAENACGTDSFNVEIDILVTVTEMIDNELSFDIFPNPSSSVFYVELKSTASEPVIINIYNILGKRVYKHILPKGSAEIRNKTEISGLRKGIYFVSVETGNYLTTQKVIITN